MTSSVHPITPEALRLIRQCIDDVRGSRAAFCRLTGIAPYNLSRILAGKRKFIFGDDWNRLVDFIPELEPRRARKRETDAAASAEPVSHAESARPADPLLDYVNGAWPELTAEEKAEVVAVIERAKEKKTAAPAAGNLRA